MQPRDRRFQLGSDQPDGAESPPENIRDLQRRRRNETRLRADMHAILAGPDEDEEEEERSGPPGPAPGRVFLVFRGASWQDPAGALRESDTIVGVYATEDAARRAVAAENRQPGEEEGDAWYQPYAVQD